MSVPISFVYGRSRGGFAGGGGGSCFGNSGGNHNCGHDRVVVALAVVVDVVTATVVAVGCSGWGMSRGVASWCCILVFVAVVIFAVMGAVRMPVHRGLSLSGCFGGGGNCL